jgi:ubiquinone/menaquinone biosynthesis C-methylase UbiE
LFEYHLCPQAVCNTPEYWNKVYINESKLKIGRGNIKRWEVLLSKIKDGDRVVDFGCGLGKFCEFIKQNKPNCDVHGIDFSDFAIKYGKENIKNVQFHIGSKLCDIFPANSVDYISAQHIIEHYKDPKEFLKDALLVLRPKGTLALVIPVDDDPWREHWKIWSKEDVAKFLSENGLYHELIYQHNSGINKDGKIFHEMIAFAYKQKPEKIIKIVKKTSKKKS